MNDEFDFGPPPAQCGDCDNLKKEISDLHVLVDTLQTNLRSIALLAEKDDDIVNTPSYKWCISWRPGDSL